MPKRPVWKPEHCAAIAVRLRRAIETAERTATVGVYPKPSMPRVHLYDGFELDQARSLLALLEQASGEHPNG